MATNSTIVTTPHNLTALSNATSLADYVFIINDISHYILSSSLLILVFAATFFYAYQKDYDLLSCVAYSSYVSFIIAIIGASWVRAGIPFISTKVVIFLFVLSAISAFCIWFTGENK